MADSQPLSGAPEGAEYLRAVLRAPVYEAAQVTPLQKMEKLSSRLDNVILVKREDRQPVHSFKLRGAYAMMAGLTEEQKAHGVITASAGNHAQGVAFSSARLGVKALIVMPTATADIKVDAIKDHTVTVSESIDLHFKDEAKLKELLEGLSVLTYTKADQTSPTKCGDGRFNDFEPIEIYITYNDGSDLTITDICGDNIIINGSQYIASEGEYLNENIIGLFIDDLAHYDYQGINEVYLIPLDFENDEVILKGEIKQATDQSLDDVIINFKDLGLRAYEDGQELDELIDDDGKEHTITFVDEAMNEYIYTYKAN